MRPTTLPPATSYAHGTRARYVAGCRCRPCTASNTAAYHDRKRRALELLQELERPRIRRAAGDWHCIVYRADVPKNGSALRSMLRRVRLVESLDALEDGPIVSVRAKR